jgi:N-acyl-D-glutamate deacylase
VERPARSERDGSFTISLAARLACAGLALVVGVPQPVRAQTGGSLPKVGVLVAGPRSSPYVQALEDGLRGLGYTAGQTAVIEIRAADGFIDLHSHAVQLLGARAQAHDGVTTALELEAGVLPVHRFYDRIGARGWPINYGASASWALARMAEIKGVTPEGLLASGANLIAGLADHEPGTPELLDRVRGLLERALDDGALGIGVLLGYAPRTGRREFADVNRWAAARGVPTFTHLRFVGSVEPQDAFESFQEALAVAAGTGAHLHLCHVNSIAGRLAPLVLADVARAQKQGLRVTLEAYPYGAGAAAIGAAFLRGDQLARHGLKKEDLTRDGRALTAEEFDRLQREAPGTRVIVPFLRPDTDPRDGAVLDASVLFPGGAIASDAVPWSIDGRVPVTHAEVWPLPDHAWGHPRSAGTFARFLRVYVRERRAIGLRDALAKTSLIPARILEASVPQMRRKGRIATGMDADIVVFDLATIADRATYEKPAQTSTGIRHVIVAGVPVIENGVLDPASRPGRPVRRPPAR